MHGMGRRRRGHCPESQGWRNQDRGGGEGSTGRCLKAGSTDPEEGSSYLRPHEGLKHHPETAKYAVSENLYSTFSFLFMSVGHLLAEAKDCYDSL